MAPGDPLILASARRHHIDDDDILHAYRNPIRVTDQDGSDTHLIIGASRSGDLLEVIVIAGNDHNRVIHAMRARRKFLRAIRHDT